MNEFSTSELAGIRSVQVDSLQDLCVIQRHSYVTANTFGEVDNLYTDDSAATACGLEMKSGNERNYARDTLLVYDAVLRLAITASVDEKDRIKITKRYGETLTVPLIFEVVSPMQRGVSGTRVLLRKIET